MINKNFEPSGIVYNLLNKHDIQKKRNKLIYLFLFTLIILPLFIWNEKLPLDNVHFFRNVKLPVKNKSILFWDSYHGDKTFTFGFGQEIFKDCPFANCFTTANRSYMDADQFDAVVFHGARFNSKTDGLPGKRSAKQKYIFFSDESAFNTYFDHRLDKHFYNWSMTYRTDSDIFYPYGMFTEAKTTYETNEGALQNKTKPVAWFVSNCGTAGAVKRMNFVKKIAKHIPIDIYGKCGNMSCNDRAQCYRMLDQKYFFYLSFENSMCEDYITEKVYNVLKHTVVPVVHGASNYTALAPPNSVINAKDFKSPKELADYLSALAKNITEYSKYLMWKKEYVIEDSRKIALCKMCEILNTKPEYSSYENIKDWYFKGCSD